MSTGETEGLALGPVQMLAVEFDRDRFHGEILPEFRRLADAGIIRLLDLLVVVKHQGGDLEALRGGEPGHGRRRDLRLGLLLGPLLLDGLGGLLERVVSVVR